MRPVRKPMAVLVIGVIGLWELTLRPRFQAFHLVDVLQLLASGMCFGVALALFLSARRNSGRE